MKPSILPTIFALILATGISYGQKKAAWADKDTKLELNLSQTKAIENLKIEVTGIDQIEITKLSFDCSNPAIDGSKPPAVKPPYKKGDASTTILFKEYFAVLNGGKFLEQLIAITDAVNIDVTIHGKLSDSTSTTMQITIDVKPNPNAQKIATSEEIQFFYPPIPNFSSSSIDLDYTKSSRILLIDGTGDIQNNKGFQLLGIGTTKPPKLIQRKSLPANKSLTVFAKNISFEGIKSIKVNLNGTEYSYNAGVSDLLVELQKSTKKDTTEIKEASTEQEKEAPNNATKIKNYLKATVATLDRVEYLNIMDLKRLEFYKSKLNETIKPIESLLDEEAFGYLFEIMNFQPAYVNLTPFPPTVPNADEVTVESVLKFDSSSPEEKYTTGVFRTSGSLAVHVGSSLFVTGLKNNNVYTQTVSIGGQDELRAKIDEDDQMSVGIGVNSEITYRTGSMLRPSFNLAFFVPFAEEITPFVGLGPGIAFVDKNVSLNLSGGFAFGKINSIAEQYRDRNLSAITDLTNTSLVQKVWKKDWYFSIGIGFNINSDDD